MEPNMTANGNILPSRFCKVDTTYTAGLRVIAAGASDRPIGISQKGSLYMVGTAANPQAGTGNQYAAVAGDDIRLFVDPDCGALELGGTVTVGASLKPSTNGVGIATTTPGDIIGAVALQAGVSGDVINVRVIPAGDFGG